MNKKIIMIAIVIACLTYASFLYLKKDDDQQVEETNIETIIYKDEEGDLIPVNVNVHNQMEMETDIRNKLDLMKSSQMESYGLYPLFDSRLEIQSLELEDGVLSVSFNDYLYSNQDALDILEALTYVFTDYDDVQQLKLQIDGQNITYLPNSIIPLNQLTKNLGLNNFEEASFLLHQSIPVMIYREKNIHDYLYYVPTILRINENDSLEDQVQTILNHLNSQINLLSVSQEDNVLNIELDSNILLDNETIDHTLEELIVLSLTSLEGVDDVQILINGENVRNQETSQIFYNYIKM